MGGSPPVPESRVPVTKYGLHKHYIGNDVYLEPISGPDGSVLNPRYATIIFLHGQSESPQQYLKMFFGNYLKYGCSGWMPWGKSIHVILMEASRIVQEEMWKDKK